MFCALGLLYQSTQGRGEVCDSAHNTLSAGVQQTVFQVCVEDLYDQI